MEYMDLSDPENRQRIKERVKAVYAVFPEGTPMLEFFSVLFACIETQVFDDKFSIIPVCEMLDQVKQRIMNMAMDDLPSEEIQ